MRAAWKANEDDDEDRTNSEWYYTLGSIDRELTNRKRAPTAEEEEGEQQPEAGEAEAEEEAQQQPAVKHPRGRP
jgi:hypothetical protein